MPRTRIPGWHHTAALLSSGRCFSTPQRGVAAEEARGPRGLEDTATSLRKTSAHPGQSLTRPSSFQRHEEK